MDLNLIAFLRTDVYGTSYVSFIFKMRLKWILYQDKEMT